LVIGIDSDGRQHWIEEFYQSRIIQASFVDECRRIRETYRAEMFYVDPSAAGLIAEMRKAGLPVSEANNAVNDGIQSVKAMLKVQGDGRPRLTVEPACVNAINEFESYVWAKDKAGNPTDKPEKHDDHAMDAGRYATMGVNAPRHFASIEEY
jgi:phage terminase large subunit